MSDETIPKTLDETVAAIDAMLSDEGRAEVAAAKTVEEVQDLIIAAHHGLGQRLRNQWGLWADSELAQHLRKEHGVVHPDDMSHYIMDNYFRSKVRTRYERLREDQGALDEDHQEGS